MVKIEILSMGLHTSQFCARKKFYYSSPKSTWAKMACAPLWTRTCVPQPSQGIRGHDPPTVGGYPSGWQSLAGYATKLQEEKHRGGKPSTHPPFWIEKQPQKQNDQACLPQGPSFLGHRACVLSECCSFFAKWINLRQVKKWKVWNYSHSCPPRRPSSFGYHACVLSPRSLQNEST